jgi:hypothetical protein
VADRLLADRLALALLEHGPTSASRLALAVRARKADVLRELRAGPHFDHVGAGRGSRWRLVLTQGSWEPQGTIPSADVVSPHSPALSERLGALEHRLSAVELRLADAEAPL